MIEVLVVAAIVAILAGILLPVLDGAYDHARLSRAAATVRQCALLIDTYAADHRDEYPIANRNAELAALRWHEALLAAGYADQAADLDPVGVSRTGAIRVHMSMCMVYDPALMLPGTTVPIDSAASRPVRRSQVPFPSQKGLLLQLYTDPSDYRTYFCCVGALRQTPVAFADGSVEAGDRLDFGNGHPVVIVDEIGMPVFSTWGGYRSRDR